MRESEIARGLEGLYDAALNAKQWPLMLQRLSEALGAVGVDIFPGDPRDLALGLSPSSEISEHVELYLKGGWYQRDPRVHRGWPLIRQRSIVLEHDISTDEERRTGDYYAFLRSVGLWWWAAVLVKVEGRPFAFSLQRTSRQGCYVPEDIPVLASMAAPLGRALTLAAHIDRSQGLAQLDILGRLNCAAVLLDWRGLVIGTNAGAEALLGTGLSIRDRRLVAADTVADQRLRQLVGRSIAGTPQEASPVAVRRGERPILVQALPVVGQVAEIACSARAILLLTDLEVPRRPQETGLISLFGLTPAEARLAARIGTGKSLDQTAGALGISIGNARTRLKTIFRKTDTRRQAELVALLARLPQVKP